MSQHDRGAYTPQTDAPLAFDARAPRGGRRPLPMALIASGIVLLALIIAVVMYYRSGVRPAGAAPQVVGEPVGAIRTAPAQDAQPVDPAANLDVYAAQNVPSALPEPTFAAPPEQPAPRPAPQPGLRVQVEPAPGNPAPRAAPTTPVQAAPARPVQPAQAAPAPTPPPAQPPAPAPAAPAAPPSAGGAMVQIGAYSSTALADRGYGEIAGAFPGQMAGKSKRVETLSRDGKTLYRGLIAGFPNRGAAQAFCDALKASGRTCLVRG